MQDALAELRQAGIRATGPRVAILSTLRRNRRHPSAEEIHEYLHADLPTLSLSTVYETLEAFLRLGLCRRVTAGDGRLRVDGTLHEHDHATCRLCGRIFDVDRGLIPLSRVPRRLPRGLEVTGVHIQYDVICPACAALSRGRRGRKEPQPKPGGRPRRAASKRKPTGSTKG